MTFAQRSLAHIRRVIARSPWAAEMWSGITAISWGASVIAAPPQVVTWPPVAYLATLAPHQWWGVLSVVLGAAQFTFMTVDARWCRWGMCVILSWWWGALTLSVVDSVPWLPGIAVYGGWAGINLFSTVRLLRRGG